MAPRTPPLRLALAAGLLTGCGTEPAACTQEVRPGVVLELRDAFDGAALAEGARGAVHDGGFIDSLRPYGRLGNGTLVSRAAADERPGDYSVRVEHEGYYAWEGGVRVRHDGCHVETVRWSVYLTRLP
jgi:hypothetical protein